MSEKSQVTIRTTLITVIGSVLVAGLTTFGAIYAAKSTVAQATEGASKAKDSVDELKNQLAKATEQQQTIAVPVGTIIAYGGPISDGSDLKNKGWLLCDGRPVSRKEYDRLFKEIGNTWGEGDRGTTFNLPDLRGLFLRGRDSGRGRDPDRASRTASGAGGATGDAVGSLQLDAFKSHTHTWNHGLQRDDSGSGSSYEEYTRIPGTNTDSIQSKGGSETRPMNAYVNYLIKF